MCVGTKTPPSCPVLNLVLLLFAGMCYKWDTLLSLVIILLIKGCPYLRGVS